MASHAQDYAEWIEPDGLGGFASGTVNTIRTRRYHGLLVAATRPPTGRMVLVNGVEAWLETPDGNFALSSNRYAPDVIHPDGADHIEAFEFRPYPRWWFGLPDGTRVEHGIIAAPGRACTMLYWRLAKGSGTLAVRPFISGRDYHSLHHENPAFNFNPDVTDERVVIRPYPRVPSIIFGADARFVHEPRWYRNFMYDEERRRGLDYVEDLAVPGVFRWNLSADDEAFLTISVEGHEPGESVAQIRAREVRRRKRLGPPPTAAARAYIVRRGDGKTIIAGYPWFTDWGRDTFISMRGLCLATGRVAEARDILLQWAGAVSEGMLPNRFTDAGEQPEFNSVDASLWYIVAVHDFLETAPPLKTAQLRLLQDAAVAILEGYARGTRFGIAMDSDGLLMAGEPGVQLTWMDAKTGDWVVTPRIGKPVEVQALWLNALRIAGAFDPRWSAALERAAASFARRFFDAGRGCLFDVIDAGRQPGAIDRALRPNQIFAVGGLPYPLLEGERAKSVVDVVEARLLTPAGLRTLADDDPEYRGRYQGGTRERDGAYHQGTVWPWLMGPFVEAWIRVRGGRRAAREKARVRFLDPMLALLDPAGTGHLPEIADGDAPHIARGCPFQAWSVGEALRLRQMLRPD